MHPIEDPPTARSGTIWMIAFAVLVMSLAVGYGLGARKKHRGAELDATRRISIDTPLTRQVAAVADSTVHVAPQIATTAAVETVLVVQTDAVDTGYVGETEDPGLIAHGFQTIVPPEEPPQSPQSPRPSDSHLIEMLHGQQLTVSRQLLRTLTWTIEPGEITEFKVVSDWEDPEQVSWGVRVKFVAQAGGAGIRATGLLRYYGDGTEGNGYGFRDFLPEAVERFGRW